VIVVVATGPLTTVQDRGRPGWASIGVPPSGAADPRSLDLANRIVGNDPGAAALEGTLAGPRLRFSERALVAVAGAVADVSVSGVAAQRNALLEVKAGDVLEVGRYRRGVRAYVALRGGVDVEPELGSRSTDLLTGLGPPPLRDGDVLRLGPEPATPPGGDERTDELPDEVLLHVTPGPRDDWFAEGALETLVGQPWRVDPASNRVGVRLQGPSLERAVDGELLSEGLVTGALQVPPAGRPILLLNDRPTTGGYPVIAVVREADLPLAGQLAPGAVLRFTRASPA
jgi:biotin-dependent carboxylase-like uncharacterized protein